VRLSIQYIPTWLATEILQEIPYDNSVDVYSFGVIMYEMFTRTPFFGESAFATDIAEKVLEGKRPPIPESVFQSGRLSSRPAGIKKR